MSEALRNANETIRKLERKLKAANECLSLYRKSNDELKQRWEPVLQACCNAEAEVEHLQEQLEVLNLKMADYEDHTLRAYHETNTTKVVITKQVADLESRIAKLLRELENYKSNYEYALEHKKQLEKVISEAKIETDKLRSQQVNSEHLAKQVVRLQKELSELELTYCPYQKNKNDLHLPCGKCVKCKLDAAYGIIERSTKNVENLERELVTLQKKVEKEYVCEGTSIGDRVLMCGECLSCQLKQTQSVLEQTASNLIHANEDKQRLTKEKANMDANFAEQLKLGAAFRMENIALKEIIRRQRDALELIARGAFFKHHKIAHECLKDVMKYKEEKNIL